MKIRLGFDLVYECPQPTPMILTLNIHQSRAADLLTPDHLMADPPVPMTAYSDSFGNWCTRIIAPPGRLRLYTDTVIHDSGLRDPVVPEARQTPVHELPDDTLQFLAGSRYCETDRLSDIAWSLFGNTPEGWPRVQAVVDFVHDHIEFGYQHARATRTAWEAYHERIGVCRDFTHLAITFCRALNIPARYCTGYLGDIGVPRAPEPMDFSAWMEVWLEDRWYAFDPRNHKPRIGRVLIARGRDAADVPISNAFGPSILRQFHVHTDEVTESLQDRLQVSTAI